MNFVGLFSALDTSHSTHAKRDALVEFIQTADPLESALGVEALTGRIKKNRLRPSFLRKTGMLGFNEQAWLFEECYATVGDLSETLAILFASPEKKPHFCKPVLAHWAAQHAALSTIDAEEIPSRILSHLLQLSKDEAFLFLKLSTGGFRVGVSKGLVHEAIARATHIDRAVIEERMMGVFNAEPDWLEKLKTPATEEELDARPVPFLLAQTLSAEEITKIDPSDVIIEYKWDGIRAQLIKTHQITRLWSRGDQDITEQFPEIIAAAQKLPAQLILDGEILAGSHEAIGSFNDLQTRLNRKRITKKLLQTNPAFFRAYDLIRRDGLDYRGSALIERKEAIADLQVSQSPFMEPKTISSIQTMREAARAQSAEGVMIKRRFGLYQSGRKANLWWKWKLDPMTADCVLIYAQAGHGRRAALHTDYTLACWNDEGNLVPVAKAYTGLTDQELKQVDKWIRAHTINKFGPVRQVQPLQVFELGFEGIARSTRHKSGIALRFPRILRWRTDVGPMDADQVSHFYTLMDQAYDV